MHRKICPHSPPYLGEKNQLDNQGEKKKILTFFNSQKGLYCYFRREFTEEMGNLGRGCMNQYIEYVSQLIQSGNFTSVFSTSVLIFLKAAWPRKTSNFQ